MQNRVYTILWILVALLLSAGVAGFAYYFLFVSGGSTNPPETTPEKTYGTLFPSNQDVSTPKNGQTNTGDNLQNNGQFTGTSTNNISAISTNTQVPLKQITKNAISGSVMLGTGTTTTFRYMERANGRISEIAYNETLPETITNTTFTKVQESYWNATGSTTIFRFYKNDFNALANMLATAYMASSTSGTGISGELKGTLLPDTISNIAISPDKKSVFYLSNSGTGVVGIVTDFTFKKKKQVFDSPLSEWITQWINPTTIAISTRPSAFSDGALYILNTSSASGSFALSGFKGLSSSVSPNGKVILHTISTERGLVTSIYDKVTGNTSPAPITVLAEKCIWSAKSENIIYCAAPSSFLPASYPDDWYLGAISFNDKLWKVNIDDSSAVIVLDPSVAAKQIIDIQNIALNKDESIISFQNKIDGTLWAADLSLVAK